MITDDPSMKPILSNTPSQSLKIRFGQPVSKIHPPQHHSYSPISSSQWLSSRQCCFPPIRSALICPLPTTSYLPLDIPSKQASPYLFYSSLCPECLYGMNHFR